ncbi:McrB family protein [Cloacibacterium sp.]|uniref:McrB family protein n=1 Tax=Cloacibacterium sp. TaxID=1913682 RepID=UPI0039E3667E
MIDYNILIDRFLNITDVIGNPNEGYKYDAINHFQSNWILESSDFHTMFRTAFAKRENLFYQNSWGFIDKCAEHFPEITRMMFRDLYDENIDLEVRISNFQSKADELLDQLKSQLNRENLNAQQDERTVSVYLGFRYPEKYIFYMFSFYGRLAKEFNLVGDFREKKNYLKLLSLLPDFKKVVKERKDFVEHYRSFYATPNWDDTNLMIQNILYVGYRLDLDGIYDGSLLHFSKNELLKYYQILDKLIERFNLQKKDYRVVFNESEKQLNFTVGQKYVWCLKSKNKLNRYRAIANEKFGQSIEIFNSEANKFLNDSDDFNLIDKNFDLIASAIGNELEKTNKSGYYKFNSEFFERMAFDKEFRTLILEKVVNDSKSEAMNYWVFQCNPKNYFLSTALRDNAVNSWKVNSHRENIKIGDKAIIWLTGQYAGVYALATIVSLPSLDIEDDLQYYKVQPNKDEYRVSIEIDFNCYNRPILKIKLEKYSWFSNMNVGLQGTNFKSSEEEYYNLLSLINNTNEIKKLSSMKLPLNQILYGPPGTGKTYNTINKAISITNPSFDLNQNRDILNQEYARLVEAGQIVFTTFHQSMSYEDFIEGIKPIMNEGEGDLTYEIQNGIFKEICKSAVEISKNSIIDNFDESWEKLIESVKAHIADEKLLKIGSWEYGLSTKESLKYSSLNSPSQYTFTITKQNIKDAYQDKQARPSGAFQKDMLDIVQYMKSHFKLSEYQKDDANTGNNEQIKNYVLIIDEINRGNVSQIFGELITLIEEGKRLGNEEELKVTLPYSKKEFGVPSNLYIIGTMNTADRSVEALDTALRRRFSFIEMMPDIGVVEKTDFLDFPRVQIMQKINERVELLLDKNYTLGHSYFIKDNFRASFKNEIIPLLQEYFYNDFGKMGLILGRGFVREKEISKFSHKSVFADFETRNEIEIIKSYELIPFEEVEFNNALELLLA